MMEIHNARPLAAYDVTQNLTVPDLLAALKLGWQDFAAYPLYGLVIGCVFAGAGLLLSYALLGLGEASWLVPLTAGFPLLAPFTAVGLFEVSRRRENDLPVSWRSFFGAVRGRGDEQIVSMGGVVFVAFGFWMIVAHAVFAIFVGEMGMGAEALAVLQTGPGLAMLGVGSLIGGLMAFGFYAITVISLPMLVDREIDFLSAIIISLKTMKANGPVMLIWAAIIVAALVLAMIPAFLGLLVVLPVFGHATWHLYRRCVTAQT